MATDVGGIDVRDTASAGLQRLIDDSPASAARALNIVSEETMTDAKNRTPVEFGNLKRSGLVHLAAKDRLATKLTFGTEYAIFVHERTELQHNVGQAKFLETALQFAAVAFAERIAALMRADIARTAR